MDNAASGANTGKSWTDAWKSFAAIVWGAGGVGPGDTLYISGGSSSKTYSETLTPAASGTSGKFITIDVGANSPSPAGHNGTVIIDGGAKRNSGIYINGYNYVRVNGQSGLDYKLLVQNHVGTGAAASSVTARNCSYVYLDYIKVDNGKSRGITFYYVNNGRIRGCDIRTGNVTYNGQTDCMYIQSGNDNVIEDTVAINGNNDPDDHMDCLQVYGEARLTIRRNWLEWTSGCGNGYCQAFIIEQCSDWVYIYNNVILGCSKHEVSGAVILKDAATGGVLYLWNNTVVAQHATGTAMSSGLTDAQTGQIKNNILHSPNGYLLYFGSPPTASKVDYNCLYRTSGTKVSFVGGEKTWTQHQAAGYDVHGINQNPECKLGYGCGLNATSPCINAGTDLSAYFTTDRHGNAIPSGSAWDMGAMEA